MRRRRRATIQDLRLAIDCLPYDTRVAMLEGIRSNDIIVGAYSDGNGVCPMLAAHRAGGRTNFIGFARAWDAFAFSRSRVRVARRATERELLILRTHLEASLLEDEGPAPDLTEAVAEHRALVRKRALRDPQRARPGDPDRSRELRGKAGWAWMRVFSRYDDYQRALARLHEEHDARSERERAERQPVG
jgi:hypothetical protein